MGAFVERAAGNSAAEGLEKVQRLQCATAVLVVELQRADGKATAVCGAAGGFLTASVALLGGLEEKPWGSSAALFLASVSLAVAVGVALWALRPVLPRVGSPEALLGVRRGDDIGPVVASIAGLSVTEQLRMEEVRLAVLAGLARRKFRAVCVAVDLVVAALTMAGMGLLLLYVMA
ncbi:hypothetical protein [Streptomyces sudanensis]|uniref:Pycsar effector protein domain-containing protein n=1 Tax=Streptomyces sudanensis TaxID=436397 RepID=A0ABY4TII1_9ACTN|nr:hypothetical protein [Streptomyces sudanensis]MCP9956068.1 hypothetical protein [Streptomyces sudanensis]URN18562.1 hypothetical protein MW084_24300 [Streptomyces sudanensis]